MEGYLGLVLRVRLLKARSHMRTSFTPLDDDFILRYV